MLADTSIASIGSSLRSWWSRHPRIILAIITLAFLLPFADKAVHIDDPLFIWAGRQMQHRWWDPYGFEVNWYGWPMPMHEVTKNPPLACAFIALINTVFGENEYVLHVSFFVQAILLVLGTYTLASRLCRHPTYAATVTLFTPVFLVSATTLMCDVLMVMLWVWALVFWIRGVETNRASQFVLAAFLVGASSLAKYFGIALVPLLLVYTLLRNGRPGLWLLYLLIPLIILGLYEGGAYALYGHGLIMAAFRYAGDNETFNIVAIASKALTAVGFVGGCCAIVLFAGFAIFPIRLRIGAMVTVLILLPITWMLSNTLSACTQFSTHVALSLFWALLVVGGVAAFVLPMLEWKRARSPDSVLLLLWVWGTFVFCILNWTINARSVLPLVPAVSILLLRKIESDNESTPIRLNWPLGITAIFSLLISAADYRLANCAREATVQIQTRFGDLSSRPIWFQGHWGFEYYAQNFGWQIYDPAGSRAKPGDLIVLPFNNTNLKSLPENSSERVAIIELPVLPGIATMSRAVGAGFYMDIVGPLPFSVGPIPAEKYYVVRFK